MISSEVQRTLVKSAPELWAELSDEAALARHLGEFGQVRITRATAEERIEWEAESARGSIAIKPSGWGTRVTLIAQREVDARPADHAHAMPSSAPSGSSPAAPTEPETPAAPAATAPAAPAATAPAAPAATASAERTDPAPAGLEADAPAAPPTVALAVSAAMAETEAGEVAAGTHAQEIVLEPAIAAGPATDTEPALEPDAGPVDVKELLPRRGFFARLLARWRPPMAPLSDVPIATPAAPPARPEPPPSPADTPAAALEETETTAPTPDVVAPASVAPPAPSISAELKAAEELAKDETASALSAVLDRLGSAHHRPFSRA